MEWTAQDKLDYERFSRPPSLARIATIGLTAVGGMLALVWWTSHFEAPRPPAPLVVGQVQ
jgi:hypothetical protein